MLSYNSVKELVDMAIQNKCRISEICIKDQAKKMGKTEDELFEQMEKCFETMCESAEWGEQKGRRSTSGLTGDEGYLMKKYAEKDGGLMGKPMSRAVSRALAVSNCNAAMGKIVATPTAGSCGILPGCLITAYKERQMPKKDVVMSIFTAAAFGMIIAQKASIAGAQGGCQAECGSASGMAAAALVELMGGTPQMCADALAIAIVNQEGLVCDPVAGLVEIPCIKRNASGVVIAFSSADMALAGIEAKIPADECIDAMREVGDAMSRDLKETATGGLAATPTGKKYRAQVFGE
ncbi:MAG: L-serine ammonia-lyase, iron-sulfur-dependent, subunit alpha [Oribacterium sp.]|nr:L-serine ammonia-lyase, iron-sulfur-dependent, subunit alpha [Oribacterium sp.]MBO6308892.1 L-serine ammonia-lyase, iron-sulfur-dependent, subunit alpha [Oribacterium sp.]MBP3803684.1 L-serine ammonia-lyase, iron-sulfur-dependent, subunit alpha [Oribacterium sp.]